MINLEEHKIHVASLGMEVVPLSIAKQAVKEAIDPPTEKYMEELESTMKELRDSLNSYRNE
jgi:hypothetical protein